MAEIAKELGFGLVEWDRRQEVTLSLLGTGHSAARHIDQYRTT